MKKTKNKKILKVAYQIFKTLMTMLIIALILVIVVQRVSNNKISVAGFRIFNVATESMVPKYLVGDVLIVKKIDVNDLEIGDDITYQGEKESFAGKVVTHQLIDIETAEDGTKIYHTKGIANDKEDPTISASQIYGVVVAKLTILTYLSGIINNMWIMYAILIISIAVIMFLDIKDLKKDENEEIEEIEKENSDTQEQKKKKVNKMREKRRKKRQEKE